MPIIRSRHGIADGIADVQYHGDKMSVTHAQDVIPFYEYAYSQRKRPGNGFSKKRQFRKIASVPTLAWYELVKRCGGNPSEKEIKRFLNSEEGKMFRTVEGGI